MQKRDWIAIAGIMLGLVSAGAGMYVNVRDRLVRIETILNNGMSHTVQTHSQAITQLQTDLHAHLLWAEERSRTLQRDVDRKN